VTHTRPRPLEIADRCDVTHPKCWHPAADTRLLLIALAAAEEAHWTCVNAVRASAPADKTDEMLTSQFRSSAICMDNSCSGMMV